MSKILRLNVVYMIGMVDTVADTTSAALDNISDGWNDFWNLR